MTTIKETALSFESRKTKNITELKTVPVALDLKTEVGVDADGKDYHYAYFELNNDRYRVPGSVLAALNAILQKKPNLQNFAVTKTGEGRNTRYTVIPLD